MMRLSVVFSYLPLAASLAAPLQQSTASTTTSASVPQSTACGDVIGAADLGYNIFLAKDVYDCLISVPFNAAVATRFVRYYNDTIQFQSTLAYLKNPPTSYQQPAVDLIAGLGQIQRDIDSGFFQNQYAFEATLQNLIYSAHDTHLQLYAGILSTFSFGSPYELATVSVDGVQLPQVYISDDLFETQNGSAAWQPSPIATINGQGVEEYLAQFAAVNAFGCLEPSADWNQLMYSPALGIQGYFSGFGGSATFYPGENLTFKFENGTELDPVPWLAIYNSQGPTGPLTTGGDFYNFFVLGLYPASYNATSASSTTVSASTPTNSATSSAAPMPTAWDDPAYPSNPEIVQPDLSTTGGGFLTGYLLNDTSIGVLSIPSFEVFGDALGTFSTTVGEFIQRGKMAGMKRIVIDVQQNNGGDALLAIDTFKQFFPTIDPFGGSRLRAHPAADVLGNTITDFYDTLPPYGTNYEILSANEWVATDRLDAETGENFTSWGQFYGPNPDNGDFFTTTQRYNLSSPVFDTSASGGILVYGYGSRPATSPQPYAAEDIIILTDGLCSSACALFMEMMHHEAGVRTVVVGGQPSYGPMQAPSGNRGAAYYTSGDIDININYTESINTTTVDHLPIRTDNDFYITRLGVNLRDQIRKSEYVPLQFLYEAANCRIFYTPQTIYNYTNLWNYAANAIYSKPELCVRGSTGYATSNATYTKAPLNATATLDVNVLYNISGIIRVSGSDDGFNTSVSRGITAGFVPISKFVQRPPSSGLGPSVSSFNKNVPLQFRNKMKNFNRICAPGAPSCGGTRTGPYNPNNTLAPLQTPEPPV